MTQALSDKTCHRQLLLDTLADIRHPWLKFRSRQRPVAVLLRMNRTLRKSNVLHSHKYEYIFVHHDLHRFMTAQTRATL